MVKLLNKRSNIFPKQSKHAKQNIDVIAYLQHLDINYTHDGLHSTRLLLYCPRYYLYRRYMTLMVYLTNSM